MGKHPWLDEYLLSKAGCTKDYKEEWEWHRYLVGGKMFAALLHPSDNNDPVYAGKDLISLKCDPLMADVLRENHSEILPDFYIDKRNWSSIDLGGDLPENMIKQMIDESYRLVFEKLTKKIQKEISNT